jgi:hypothetical protein
VRTTRAAECKKVIEAKGEFQKVSLDPRVLDKTVCIGTEASQQDQAELLSFLDKNNDVFAWSTSDLVVVNRDVIEHRLQFSPNAKPKKQKLRKMVEEKVQAAKADVQRLLGVGFIKEQTYLEWLSNVVMVKKKNGKWWMCTYFTNLNKYCLKDDFPLPRINKIIDSAAASEMMALLDCFSGYHQIWLHIEDEENTSFIISFGTYSYRRMLEGLRNAGPTFCRMTKAALKDQVDRNVFSYVDDIVVVSKNNEKYLSDLAETFANMQEAKLKLNLKKCVFGITREKVLGCLVSMKGIEANPDKIKAITQMQPPQSRNDVQKLTGRIASLNRFISKLAEHSLPFFTVLRGSVKIEWGAEQQKTFEGLKSYLEKLPMLSSPEQGQLLILYVSATHSAVSGALVVTKETIGNGKADEDITTSDTTTPSIEMQGPIMRSQAQQLHH